MTNWKAHDELQRLLAHTKMQLNLWSFPAGG